MLLRSWIRSLCNASEPNHTKQRPGRRRQRPSLSVEPLEDRCLLASGLSAAIVADIVPGTDSSNPHELTNADGALYFRAADPAGGSGLWKSDGTAAGTVLVADGLPGGSSEFTSAGASVFFTIGGSLWHSDGTESGTTRLNNSSFSAINLTAVGETLFFSGRDWSNDKGWELWKSDGTLKGTKLVKDIYAGSTKVRDRLCGNRCGSVPNHSSPAWLTDLNGTVFFAATSGKDGQELWRSDGTGKGTKLVKDISAGSTGSDPQYLTVMNGRVYFGTGDGLWSSDGTESGTVQVKSLPAAPSHLIDVNGTLFFTVDDGIHGREIWKSDGTAAGTVLVKDVSPGSATSNPLDLIAVNSTLFFSADDGVHGRELWKSDGTSAGTVILKDINSGGQSSLTHEVQVGVASGRLANVNGLLYFAADDGVNGRELWQSDGTASGTVMVEDIYPGATGSDPAYLVAMNNKLYFAATDPVHGRELWDPPAVVTATTFTVSNLHDSGPGSLRDAIESANALPGADVIEFSTRGTISLTSGEIEITDDLTIHGAGKKKLSVDGSGADRIFAIRGDGVDVAITDLTVSGGQVSGPEALGGAILNDGSDLLLRDMVFTGNRAIGENRDSAVAGGGAIANLYGATLIVDASAFSDNHATAPTRGGGGAILNDAGSALTVIDSSFTGNTATGLYLDHARVYGAEGGAIANSGGSTTEVSRTSFTGNGALGLDSKDAPGRYGGSSAGGAISNSPSLVSEGQVERDPVITINHSTFLENRSLAGDGGDAADGLSVASGGYGVGGAIVNTINGVITISDSLLQSNLAQGGAGGDSFSTQPGGSGGNAIGGAFLNTRGRITVERTAFIDNVAMAGRGGNSLGAGGNGGQARGGVMHDPGFAGYGEPGEIGVPPTISFIDTVFQGNAAIGGDGGHGGDGQGGKGGFARGGALSTNETTVRVENGRFDGNLALGGKGGTGATIGNGGHGYGGAISNGNEFADPGKTANWLTVMDSTLTNNQALGGAGTVAGSGFGGAIMNGAKAEATISGAVIENNQAIGGVGNVIGGHGYGGGIYNRQYAELTLINSSVTRNEAIGGTGGSENGEGVGGGIYNESGGDVFLDSLDVVFANIASTEDDDWFGLLSLV